MNILINWLNGNEGVIASFNLITTIITCFIFLGILFLTVIYAGGTVYLAYKTSKSVEITKEKENTDRAIVCLERFENLRLPLFNLAKKKQLKLDNDLSVIDLNDEGTWYEIRDIIIFFNIFFYLIKLNKVDAELIESELGSSMRSFLRMFIFEIPIVIDKLNPQKIKRYDFKNYLEFCLKSDERVKFFINIEKRQIKNYIERLDNLK